MVCPLAFETLVLHLSVIKGSRKKEGTEEAGQKRQGWRMHDSRSCKMQDGSKLAEEAGERGTENRIRRRGRGSRTTKKRRGGEPIRGAVQQNQNVRAEVRREKHESEMEEARWYREEAEDRMAAGRRKKQKIAETG